MNLKIEKVRRSKRKKDIKAIYEASFPKRDRMAFWLMIVMSYLWNTEFLAFYDQEELVGFIYLANIGRQTFVMFFAVDKEKRSKGYGSEILNLVSKKHPKNKIIISIEPCDKTKDDYEINKKRKEFYLRNGYKEAGYMMRLYGINQEIIIKNGIFKKSKFILFFMIYSNLVVIPKIWKKEKTND